MTVIASQSETTTVFRFSVFDIRTDQFQRSQRWATAVFIEKVGGRSEGEGVNVDSNLVDADSLTERGFDPHRRPPGFQTSAS